MEVDRHCATFYSVSELDELPPIATNSAPRHVQIYEFDFDEIFGKWYLSLLSIVVETTWPKINL